VAKQEEPKSAIELGGFPFHDLWEEAAPSWERLYDHGIDREIIDQAFKKANKLGADELGLTKGRVRETLACLELGLELEERLADRLYYLAGHYYSPRFHKLFGDDPTSARRHLNSIAATAAKLRQLTSKMSASMMRQFGAVRLQAHARRIGTPFVDWSDLAQELEDIEMAAATVAAEIPIQKRGSNLKVLQGRWLRHTVEAIELATSEKISTKTRDAAGINYRLPGPEGKAFSAYCDVVDGKITPKTLVDAVRTFRRDGIGRPPS
jgi:hypothetical protein